MKEIKISLSRYNKLIKEEISLKMIEEKLMSGKIHTDEELLRIIGTKKSIKRANKLKKKYERSISEMKNKEAKNATRNKNAKQGISGKKWY